VIPLIATRSRAVTIVSAGIFVVAFAIGSSVIPRMDAGSTQFADLSSESRLANVEVEERTGAEADPGLPALGWDIGRWPVVVNSALPRSAMDYTHRIGRTGRAGEAGVAISFITAETQAHFQLIEKRHRLNLTREQIPGFEPTEPASPPAPGTGGIKGRRKSKKDRLREAADRQPPA